MKKSLVLLLLLAAAALLENPDDYIFPAPDRQCMVVPDWGKPEIVAVDDNERESTVDPSMSGLEI